MSVIEVASGELVKGLGSSARVSGSAVMPGWDARLSAAIHAVFKEFMAMDTEALMAEYAKADPDRMEAIRRGMVID